MIAEARGYSKTSVAHVLAAYESLHIQNLRTGGERKRMLTQALEPFLEMPVGDLRRSDLQGVIDAKANLGALVYANRFKAALAHFARFAWSRGYSESHIGAGLTGAVREIPRDRVLNLEEMRAIWDATLEETGVFGPLVRLLILTPSGAVTYPSFNGPRSTSKSNESSWRVPAQRIPEPMSHTFLNPPCRNWWRSPRRATRHHRLCSRQMDEIQ